MSNIRLQQAPNGIALLTFERANSSANIFDRATLEELDDTLDQLAGARGLILTSAKDAIFVAGADLHAVGKMSAVELEAFIALGQNVFNKLAALPIVTVAAIHGAALGGGYELCLACDYRIASDERVTRIGLPETKLGILPAWGGSTRLPRLIGVPKALEIILEGRVVASKQALRLGMIDEIAPRQYLERVAMQWVATGKHHASFSHSAPVNAVVDVMIAPKVRASVLKKTHGHYPAVQKALEVVMAGASSWDEAGSLARERQAIVELVALESTQNLMRLFFLQERAKKLAIPGAVGSPAPGITQVAVVGAGVMGSGIAQWLSAHGTRTLLRDIDASRVATGMGHVSKLYTDAVKHRSLTAAEARAGMDRISPTATPVPMHHVDLVIEAAVENMETKRTIFRGLEESTTASAILATNTSALSISELASGLQHPGRVIGMHFFNPVHKMQLVEVVVGRHTSPEVIRDTVRFVQKMGKLPVLVRDSPGFLVNRILLPYMIEAGVLFENGASVEDVDTTMIDFGMPMGPLRLIDEVGVDIAEDVAKTLAQAFPDRLRVPQILPRLMGAGLLGRKSGQGFYVHRKDHEPEINRAVPAFQVGSSQPGRDELQRRMVLLMVNEAARCVEELIVDTPADVDFAMVMGTGFAPFRGGPLRYADHVGTRQVCAQLRELATTAGSHFAPCALLETMDGKSFYEN